MISNEVYANWKAEEEDACKKRSRKRRKRVEEHELAKIPAGCGKWNGTIFRPMKQSYQKYW